MKLSYSTKGGSRHPLVVLAALWATTPTGASKEGITSHKKDNRSSIMRKIDPSRC